MKPTPEKALRETIEDLLTAYAEIMFITDREHNAWFRAKAAIARAERALKDSGEKEKP